MRLNSRLMSLAGLAIGVAIVAGACSSAAATDTPGTAVQGASATPAMAAGVAISSTNDASLGAYLTGQNGMTLYVFTKDSADTSSCTGKCATTWPPLVASSGATITGPAGAASAFATIARADGTTQVTYNHIPLYYYSGDSKPGDITGEGKFGFWFVAPLSGVAPTAVPSTAPAAPTTAPAVKPTTKPTPAPTYSY
jgi:predicted lipoprotein with Yx(FWY)xxD motif